MNFVGLCLFLFLLTLQLDKLERQKLKEVTQEKIWGLGQSRLK